MEIINEENCLISIVIPVYNAEKYLGGCLNSIQNQTYKNLKSFLLMMVQLIILKLFVRNL